MIRLMENKDLYQCLNLLQQLTIVYPTNSKKSNNNSFEQAFKIIKDNPYYYIFVYDLKDNEIELDAKSKIVGMCSIFIEQKLIHNAGKVGHIEDVVVDKDHRYTGIGKKLIQQCINISKDNDCYKILLNCNDDYIPFYTKLGFKKINNTMRLNN